MGVTINDSGLGLAPGHPDYGRARVALLLVGVATLGLMYAPQPLLPVISEQYDLSASHASWLMSAVTLGVAVGVLPLGAASARWGRGRMIVAGLALATVAGLSLGVLTPWWALVLARFIQGVGIAAVLVSAMAWVVDNVAPRAVARVGGLYIAGTTLGGMGGRILSGALTDLLGSWHMGLLCAGVLLAAVGGLAHLLLPSAAPLRPRVVPSARVERLVASRRVMYALAFCGMAVHSGVYNAAAFRGAAAPLFMNPAMISLLFLAYGAGTLTSSLVGRVAARIPPRVIHVVALTCSAGGLAVSLIPQLWSFVLGLVMLSAGFFAVHALANPTAARLSAQPSAGAARYNLAYYVGASVGAVIFATAWDAGGWGAVVVLACGFLGVAAVLAWIWAPREVG